MKQLKSMFRPRTLLLATALAASGVVCAQTTGAAAPAAPAGASTSTVPAACAGMEGTALSDCIKLNAKANDSASTMHQWQRFHEPQQQQRFREHRWDRTERGGRRDERYTEDGHVDERS
jgi:hypothetical protein